jgi:hypothetical protein
MEVRLVQVEPERATVRIAAADKEVDQTLLAFSRALTAEGIAYWAETGVPSLSPWPVAGYDKVLVTLQVVSEASQPAHLVIAANPAIHDPRRVLAALASIQNCCEPAVTSLNVVDRFIVRVEPKAGTSLRSLAVELLQMLLAVDQVPELPSSSRTPSI